MKKEKNIVSSIRISKNKPYMIYEGLQHHLLEVILHVHYTYGKWGVEPFIYCYITLINLNYKKNIFEKIQKNSKQINELIKNNSLKKSYVTSIFLS